MTSHLLALLLSLITVTLPPRYGCVEIIGGRVVRPHSWPFMAAIQIGNTTICGGTLVDGQWVLTAVHCEVVLGAHQASIAEKEQQIFKVKGYFPHPQFHKSSGENDIMLLKLKGIAKQNRFVHPLSLPDSYEDTKPGTKCKVAGWGDTSSGKPSKYLEETTVLIVDRNSCKSKYEKCTKITSNMLCALGKKKIFKKYADTCKGDSGGPLICDGQYSGIVSFGKGKGCGRRDIPGVYTRLTEKYIVWIKKLISLHRDP
ncbi:GRAA protein, partial [Rostratula benghalensis]|nr:GRAA protein [Rostratula benghalensis]